MGDRVEGDPTQAPRGRVAQPVGSQRVRCLVNRKPDDKRRQEVERLDRVDA